MSGKTFGRLLGVLAVLCILGIAGGVIYSQATRCDTTCAAKNWLDQSVTTP